MEGLERWAASGKNPGTVASVASFFISRIDSLVDKKLEAAGADPALQGKAAVANGIVAYDRYAQLIGSDRWKALASKGARTQALWRAPARRTEVPKTKYVDELIAQDTVNTIPEETFNEYREHGQPGPGLASSFPAKLEAANKSLAAIEKAGVSMKAVTDELLKDGVAKFSEAFEVLLRSIEKKRNLLKAA